MRARSVIVRHGDPDGMASATMLLWQYGPGAEARSSNGVKLAASLGAQASRSPWPLHAFIGDVPPDRGVIGRLEETATRLKTSGSLPHLHDHHLGWEAPEIRDPLVASRPEGYGATWT